MEGQEVLMKSHATSTFVLLLLSVFAPGLSGFSINASVSPEAVTVGSSANLTCSIKLNGQSTTQSLYWYYEGQEVSENCKPYPRYKGLYTHWPNNSADCSHATQFVLTIRQVQWSQRGAWHCKYAANSSNPVFVRVIVPSRVGSFSAVSATATAPLVGNGSQSAPFNLGGHGGLLLACRSSCGFPASEPRIRAVTGARPGAGGWLSALARSNGSSGECEQPQRARAIEAELSNCSAAGLSGRVQFRCTVGSSSADLHVLCPRELSNRSHLLTPGEVAAASAASVLALLLAGLGFAIFCSGCSDDADGDDLDEAEDSRLTGRAPPVRL